MRTRKIRFFPTEQQKLFFNKCFAASRYFYNKAIDEINSRYNNRMQEFRQSDLCVLSLSNDPDARCNSIREEGSFLCTQHKKRKLPWQLNIKLESIRSSIMRSDKELRGSPDDVWQIEIPYDTRQLAIDEAISAYKSSTALKAKNLIDRFELKHRSKRASTETFNVTKKALFQNQDNQYGIFRTRFNKDNKRAKLLHTVEGGRNPPNKRYIDRSILRFGKHKPDRLPEHDFKIMRDHGKYYILLVYDVENEETKKPNAAIVSLDPGVRCFQTGYDPTGKILQIGDKMCDRLQGRMNRMDRLWGVHDRLRQEPDPQKKKRTKRKRYNIRKRIKKIRKKIKDLVTNLHNQTASALTREYQNILLPEFCTSVMLKGTKLARRTKRLMHTLSFYRFKQKMKHEASKRHRNLYIVTEEYTSKTCGRCGHIHRNLGSSKIFICPECGYNIDRDVNGARNILIKNTASM